MPAQSKRFPDIIKALEHIHLGTWIMEQFGWISPYWWRSIVSAIGSLLVQAWAGTQHLRPVEAFVLSLVAFAAILFVWGNIAPSKKAQSIGPKTATLQENGPEALGQPPHFGSTRHAASVSLRPSYAKGDGVHHPKLIFKTDSARPLRITKIGPIVSEERYVCEREITLLQDVYPDIDSASPLECEVSGVKGGGSLESALKCGGPQTMDSISIEYVDSDKNQHRARFFLFKNPDGSIAWREDLPADSGVQDLAELWHKLSLLRKAPKELIPAGEQKLLGEEAAELEGQLRKILQENSDSHLRGEVRADLSHPVSREIAYLPEGIPEPLPWWQLRLMSFRDRYLSYWERCVRRTLQGDLPLLPSDLDANQFIDVLYKHRQWLMTMREGVESIYPDDPTA